MPGNKHNRIDGTRKTMRIASHDNRLVLLQHGEDGRQLGIDVEHASAGRFASDPQARIRPAGHLRGVGRIPRLGSRREYPRGTHRPRFSENCSDRPCRGRARCLR